MNTYIKSARIDFMNAIITVVGSDKVGIISEVSSLLAQHKANIVDITQTILSGNFVMMMVVNLDEAELSVDELRSFLKSSEEKLNVEINVMAEKVFSSMNRI